MAKKKQGKTKRTEPDLYAKIGGRRRRALILPRLLATEADKMIYRGQSQDRAHDVIKRWADLELDGHLDKKETALDAGFLLEVFGKALDYRTPTESPTAYELERNFTVPGVGTADGALGNFGTSQPASPVAVIELKDKDTDLDHDRFNGRTPVQQCWDYLNALPQCPWGIVSNFVSFRLYHRDRTPLAYEQFHLQDLREIDPFRRFFCLFERGGLLRSRADQAPRAPRLLAESDKRQREVGDALYNTYRDNRFRLIEHLHRTLGKPLTLAIHIAQKLLDRIIFIAFCEDRGLLPEQCIKHAYEQVPPFSKVTNPRWRNFLGLFHAVDQGHTDLNLNVGYNGGLFRTDHEVDNLDLDDSWTNLFHTIGTFDFREEVNVEVLGHLFEKSVGELERLRAGGLFFAAVAGTANGDTPTMPKSPERKRFGIYYTPPEFTRFVVEHTVGALIDERLETLRKQHGLAEADLRADEPSTKLAAYWRACGDAVRQIKVCDPACGSGAFLVQAYDRFEERYELIADHLGLHDPRAAQALADAIPDIILADNLHGVDVSEQAIEITQLALWIRSARLGKTLADLSRNIVWGNSLVTASEVHERALHWHTAFPGVFGRDHPGFDCVIGNPPWERLKLQEREFFAFSAPKIAGAVSAAQRRQLIAQLETKNPELYAAYRQAKESAERTLEHVRTAGEFPMTAKGDVNTYMLFAELARKLVAPHGRAGLLVPSGIATDNTTREFFASLIDSKALLGLYDFENRLRIFPDIDGRFKFSVLLFAGTGAEPAEADFVFFAHAMDDLNDKDRHISLSNKDIALLNPNTHTCPIFRTRRDAELTKHIYRNVPVLIDHSRKEGGNPWGVHFVTMFHQTNDAELFRPPDELKEEGFKLDGNRWVKGKRTLLPLYEAKMIQAYDHRAASVVIAGGNWVRQGQTEETSLVQHQNPEFVAQPRWWVEDKEVERVRGDNPHPGCLCYKDVTSATNQRTVIAALIPNVAVVNSAPLMLTETDISPRQTCCLLANLNAFALDFVARQKVGGLHLNFFIVEQFPIFPPDRYAERCPWNKKQTLEKWISDRVLKLTCTANDMKPLAEAAGFEPPVHKWKLAERAELLAELDAAFFLLYGVARDDVEYILSTFQGLREEEGTPAMFAGVETILQAYDRLSGA